MRQRDRSRTLLVLTTAIATATGTLATLVAPAAAAPAATASGANKLPGLSSARATIPPLENPVPDSALDIIPPNPANPGNVRPKAKPSAFDPAKSVPVDSETTPTKRVYRNVDGTYTAKITERPARFKDAAGNWTDIDLSLVPANNGTLTARAAEHSARIGSTANASSASLDTPAGPLTLSHPDAAPVAAAVSGTRASFAGALGGRSLGLSLVSDGVEEQVTLPTKAAAASYIDRFDLPAGVTARTGAAGVDFVAADGSAVARFGSGLAYDASFPARATATAPVSVKLLSATSPASIEVGVDPAWLAAADRAYPVTIDPTFYQGSANTLDTTFIGWAPTTNYSTLPWLAMGNGGSGVARSAMYFDLSSIPLAANNWVTSSVLAVDNFSSGSCSPRTVSVYALTNQAPALSASSTWAQQPTIDTSVPPAVSAPFVFGGSTCQGTGWATIDTSALVQHWITSPTPNNYGLELRATDESDPAAFKWIYSAETGGASVPFLVVNYEHQPDQSIPVSPPDAAVLSTTTPTLIVQQGTDPDPGDKVQYWFRVSTAPDAETGPHVVDTQWIPNPATATLPCQSQSQPLPCYVIPQGTLQDGITYYWHVWTFDGAAWRVPTWTRSFRIDLHMGERASQPHDDIGGLKVNLASGNVTTEVASPTFPTVGGAVGLSYNYNSEAPAAGGLTGSYYSKPNATSDPATHAIGANDVATLVRNDPMVSMFWNGTSAGPALGSTNFSVRWTGYVTVPASGTYTFGVNSDDGVKLWVGDMVNPKLNLWQDQTSPAGWANPWGTPVALTAGTPTKIQIDYYQHTGSSFVALLAQQPNVSGFVIVPPSWLSSDPGSLGLGWSLSPDGGSSLSYVSARATDNGVTLWDSSGSAHVYTATAAGGYVPPPDEDGVLARDTSGRLTVQADDGLTYVFNSDGTLASATSAVDDRNPSAPLYSYGPVAGVPTLSRLRSITDRVGQRSITLSYGGDAACPTSPPTNLAVAPVGMLCKAAYWDGTESHYWYTVVPPTNPQLSQLARVEDPGGVVPAAPPTTDFAYDAARRLSQVRSPLVADAVAANVVTDDPNTATYRTIVGYDNSGRATSVMLPAPTAGSSTNRPTHTYEYRSPTETWVHAVGNDESATGFSRKVTFDTPAARWLTDTDATGRTTQATWGAGEKQATGIDPAGRSSQTDWDPTRPRPTATWGPTTASLASCQTGGASNGTCPHTSVSFDAGIKGLAAEYWNNSNFSGAPLLHSTGVPGRSDGALSVSAVPDPSLGTSWSARYTGEVNLAAASVLSVAGNGTASLLVDDSLVSGGSVGAGNHRMEVDYSAPTAGSPSLQLNSGGSLLSGSLLGPRYSLVTESVTEDVTPGSPSLVVDTAYGGAGNPDPATRLAASVTTDPGDASHLNLTTRMTYETGGFLRPTAKTLPGGNTTGYAYYANTAVVANPCNTQVTANQAGRLHITSAPSPDGGSTPAWTTEVVYDAAGRVVASRHNSDPWTCTTYDARGRVVTQTQPALPAPFNTAARTTTYTYFSGFNDPRTSTVSDGTAGTSAISNSVDLLGRTVTYIDATSHTTSSTYNQMGQLTDTSGPQGNVHNTFDAAGRAAAVSLDGNLVATPHYDSAGELATVDYGNATRLSSTSRDAAGRTTAMTFNQTGGALLTSDSVSRSQSGRVLSDTMDGAASPAWTFGYDAAGRLTGAISPAQTLVYGFGAASCGLAPNAGANSNRTMLTVNGGTPRTYCYNRADQLTSSSDPAIGTVGYDPHGNTTTIAGQTLSYDGSDRHSRTVSGSTTVDYTRDATGRIVTRSENGTATGYGFSGPGDSPSFTTGLLGAVVDRFVALPGGASLRKAASGDTWSYPNIHGDVVATANASGAKQGATLTYDPFGQGTTPENSTGNFDFGWMGQHERGTEHAPGINTIEMGARQYLPNAGRFLQVDPVEGGSANDYEYANGDPVNGKDLTGKCSWWNGACWAWAAIREARNAPYTALALAWGAANNGDCHLQGNEGMFVCTGMTGGYGPRDGVTVGNVFLTGRDKVGKDLLSHETKHADQWALGRWRFAVAYGLNELVTGGDECRNIFEWWAGFRDGNYNQCV